MIKSESVKTDYSESINNQQKLAVSLLVKDLIKKSVTRFTFVNYRQWILMIALDLVCLSFLAFVCSWIDT